MTYTEFLEGKIDLAPQSGIEVCPEEVNPDYFRDGVGYCEAADAELDAPTLFDLIGGTL